MCDTRLWCSNGSDVHGLRSNSEATSVNEMTKAVCIALQNSRLVGSPIDTEKAANHNKNINCKDEGSTREEKPENQDTRDQDEQHHEDISFLWEKKMHGKTEYISLTIIIIVHSDQHHDTSPDMVWMENDYERNTRDKGSLTPPTAGWETVLTLM